MTELSAAEYITSVPFVCGLLEEIRGAYPGLERQRVFHELVRRVITRLEYGSQGTNPRFIVTNIHAANGGARFLYEDVYCLRGQAENLIKLHKTQLSSDRTSCQSPVANQVRLVLHTGAYWLMLALRNEIPRSHALAKAEFTTLRIRLLKVGARIMETASRIRVHLASACPDAQLFRLLAGRLASTGP